MIRLTFLLFFCVAQVTYAAPPADRLNIILILADDLGCYELGCYGQTKIRTPCIDRMATEGLRFNSFYAGNAVCAPSRCCLLTGLHPGHAHVRDNREIKPEGQEPLPADAETIIKSLNARGYETGCYGKWGLGGPDSTGDPMRQGFDHFYGYLCQRHAHSYYPTYLWHDGRKVELKENNLASGPHYSHDLIESQALKFIRDHKRQPFFLFMPVTIPHMAMQVPEDSLAEYRGKFPETAYKGGKGYRPHDTPHAAYAAMVTRLDRTVGRILELIKELGLDEKTLVMFTSDNGPTHNVGGADSTFFNSAGPLRGLKGDLYEGGIRVPFVARWPGVITAGQVNSTPLAFWDVSPTLCELTGAKTKSPQDGLSFAPSLTGRGAQQQHEFLYWEFPGYGGQQAVRFDQWKAIRRQMSKGNLAIELYDLQTDPGESRNRAAEHPELVKRAEAIMSQSHVPSKLFPLPGVDPK